MKLLLKIFLLIILVIIVWLAARFIIGEPENTWICENGIWVKHGQPVIGPPESGCGDNQIIINNFFDCLNQGYPIMESYPRQCRTSEGITFVEDIGNELEKIDLIQIDSPRPNKIITSPTQISGQARGYWFFEADFPVELLDSAGNIIASSTATAQGNWMTENFVPFTAELDFKTNSTHGWFMLKKDNPSGLPENDDQLIVPVFFKK